MATTGRDATTGAPRRASRVGWDCKERAYATLFRALANPMAIFDPERFGRYLENKFRESRYKSHTELATAAGLKRSTVSALIGAKPQTATNKPSQPKADTVIHLANALKADVDEFLLEAGHAPRSDTRRRPQTVVEFVRMLSDMGIEIQFNAERLQELTPEDLQDIIDQITALLIVKTEKAGQRTTR